MNEKSDKIRYMTDAHYVLYINSTLTNRCKYVFLEIHLCSVVRMAVLAVTEGLLV